MSLATTCPSCGTVFRVVEDQLKVSDGWVRCGHCHTVFNALEGLFDLNSRRGPRSRPMDDSGPVGGARAGATASSGLASPSWSNADNNAPTASASYSEIEAENERERQLTQVRLRKLGVAANEAAPPAPTPPPPPHQARYTPAASAHAREVQDLGEADTVFLANDTGLFDDSGDTGGGLAPRPRFEPEEDDSAWARTTHDVGPGMLGPEARPLDATDLDPTLPPPGAASPVAPSFLQRADRAAWWARPRLRRATIAACAIAGVLLLLQLALAQRDQLATAWPVTQPLLRGACALVGCEIGAPRQLEALTVENTALVRSASIEGYRLQVLLRNRADHAVRAPHIELSLNDGNGAVILRRVLGPADFQQGEALEAGREAAWQLDFEVAEHRIAGYTVAIFYP